MSKTVAVTVVGVDLDYEETTTGRIIVTGRRASLAGEGIKVFMENVPPHWVVGDLITMQLYHGSDPDFQP